MTKTAYKPGGTSRGDIRPLSDEKKEIIPTGSENTARLCPVCHEAPLDFDGCLNLTCPVCGFTETGGGFT